MTSTKVRRVAISICASSARMFCASTPVSFRPRCVQIELPERKQVMSNNVPANELSERIATFNANLAKQAPDGAKALAAEVENVVRSGAGREALTVGDMARDFTL